MEKTKKKKRQKQMDVHADSRDPIKPFSELNLIDDFMFGVATEDLETCKDIVELSLNIKIRKIRWKEGQKVVRNVPGKRGIRLDFYVEDENGKIYDVEMQADSEGNIPKRTRFYKALLDSPRLKSGEKGFDELPATYIIFICDFDLFGEKKYRYTFQNCCREVPGLILDDEQYTVFLNTNGNNPDEVEPELIQFLNLVKRTTQENADSSKDERIQRMYAKIVRLKGLAEVEAEYMKMAERYRILEERAERRGEERGQKKGEEIGMRKVIRALAASKMEKGLSVEETAAELLKELSGSMEITRSEIEEIIAER